MTASGLTGANGAIAQLLVGPMGKALLPDPGMWQYMKNTAGNHVVMGARRSQDPALIRIAKGGVQKRCLVRGRSAFVNLKMKRKKTNLSLSVRVGRLY